MDISKDINIELDKYLKHIKNVEKLIDWVYWNIREPSRTLTLTVGVSAKNLEHFCKKMDSSKFVVKSSNILDLDNNDSYAYSARFEYNIEYFLRINSFLHDKYLCIKTVTYGNNIEGVEKYFDASETREVDMEKYWCTMLRDTMLRDKTIEANWMGYKAADEADAAAKAARDCGFDKDYPGMWTFGETLHSERAILVVSSDGNRKLFNVEIGPEITYHPEEVDD